MTVYEEVRSIVAEVLGIEEERIKPETRLVDDLNANSLDLVEMVTMLEEKYGLDILDEDISEIKSVNDIVEFLEERVGAQA